MGRKCKENAKRMQKEGKESKRMQREFKGNANRIRSYCKDNTKGENERIISRERRENTKRMQREYQGKAKRMQR